MLLRPCLFVLCGIVHVGDGRPILPLEAATLTGQFVQLQERLQECMKVSHRWGEAAKLMTEAVLPKAEEAYSNLLMSHLLENNVTAEERQGVAQVLWNIFNQRQDDLPRSCGGGTSDEGIMVQFGVAHSLIELRRIAQKIQATGRLPSVRDHLNEQQGELLYECIMAKDSLFKQIRIAFLINGGLPKDTPSLRLAIERKSANVMLGERVQPLKESRENFLTSLARLCDSIEEVTSQQVFDHLYTLLLKDWDEIFQLPPSFSTLRKALTLDVTDTITLHTINLLDKTRICVTGPELKPDASLADCQVTVVHSRPRAMRILQSLCLEATPACALEGIAHEPWIYNYGIGSYFHSHLPLIIDRFTTSFMMGLRKVLLFREYLTQCPARIKDIIRKIILIYNLEYYTAGEMEKNPKNAENIQILRIKVRHLKILAALIRTKLTHVQLEALRMPQFLDTPHAGQYEWSKAEDFQYGR